MIIHARTRCTSPVDLNVEPPMCRFRILNRCNARIVSLRFGGLPLCQIRAEGGLFEQPCARVHPGPGPGGRDADPRRHVRHPPGPQIGSVEPARKAGAPAPSGPNPIQHAQRDCPERAQWVLT
jgi:hypothetical protein